MLCSYQHGNRCAIWTCAIQKQISRHVGHSLHGCISVPCFDHDPHFEHVQVSRYGAFSSDNRLESMNKKYKEGLSLEKVPLSSPSACLACRLMHATLHSRVELLCGAQCIAAHRRRNSLAPPPER
jgi:hypothetical protein